MNNKSSFESKINRINEIISLLSSGDTTLDESVALYKESIELSSDCKKMLHDAELKIVEMSNPNRGEK